MPLERSPSDKARSRNVAEMVRSGYPVRQAVAAAYDTQRRAKRSKRSKRKVSR